MATKKHEEFKCPECGETFNYAKVLGRHRQLRHNVAGTAKSTQAKHKKLAEAAAAPPPEVKCPDCEFVAKNANGLSIHRSAAHGKVGRVKRSQLAKLPEAIALTATNGHHQETVAPPSIPEATLAVAFGRFQELSRSMAYEFDLPPRLFTAQLATLIYRSTLR